MSVIIAFFQKSACFYLGSLSLCSIAVIRFSISSSSFGLMKYSTTSLAAKRFNLLSLSSNRPVSVSTGRLVLCRRASGEDAAAAGLLAAWQPAEIAVRESCARAGAAKPQERRRTFPGSSQPYPRSCPKAGTQSAIQSARAFLQLSANQLLASNSP